MTAHPNFEDMAEFVFARNIDSTYFQRAARLNAHISQCAQCRDIYEQLLTARENADVLARLKRRSNGEEKEIPNRLTQDR